MRSAMLTLCILPAFVAGCGGGGGTAASEGMAIGWITRAELGAPLYPAFSDVYDSVRARPEFVELIQQVHDGVEVLVILGTWCGDSKRQVPRFLRIADAAGMPSERILLYGVDRAKKSPEGVEQPYAIERVPTFIFRKDGKEIGRIVETPAVSMEADMLAILAEAQAP